MGSDDDAVTMGFVITKSPLESGLAGGFMTLARAALDEGKKVGIFLISDGVWLAKNGLKSIGPVTLPELIEGGAVVTVSPDHLKAAGIGEDEMLEGLTVAKNTYKALVEDVMETWDKVMVI